ncbi:hypothetical protein BDR05DRAFT_963859, partial [Suillus weaverae]
EIMVFGLIQHIYNYYYPANASPSTGTCIDSQPSAAVPVFQHAPGAPPSPAAGSIPASYHSIPSSYVVININIPSSSLPPSARDLARLSDVQLSASTPSNALATHALPPIPVIVNGREIPAAAAKLDAPQSAKAATVPQPQTKRFQEDCPPQTKVPAVPNDLPFQNKPPVTPHAKSDIKQVKDNNADLSELWDGWPDGTYARLFSWEEAYQTDFLMERWANRNRGGDKGRSDDAENWQDGFRTWRMCLGIILCNEPTCQIITRPATRKATLVSQLHAPCDCGGRLVHQECPGKVTSILYRFRGGVYYEHHGNHDHARPARILHLTKSQRARFESIVAANPHARAAELYTGVAGLTGPQSSVAEISSVLYNVDRIKAELRCMRESSVGEFADADVDLECPSVFEQRLFEKSAQSGSAGNYQWGLDAGSHQDGWDPYAGLPSHWNHEGRNEGDPDYDENELEVLCLLTFEMTRVNN